MRALGARDLAAAVGPCISVDHFEVGDEVVAEFRRVFPTADSLIHRAPGAKAHIDLKAALATQLRAAGIARFDILPHCTYADPSRFFSHRRDAGRTGRMVGLIGPRASSSNA
jgi:copper oxidase (laccase) domain-containing protein